MSYDTSDPKQIYEVKKQAKASAKRTAAMVGAIMDLQQGREWMFSLLSFCGVFTNPFATDPHRTAFLCGQMNVGQRVLAELQEHTARQYLTMIEENKRDRTSADAKPDPAGSGGPSDSTDADGAG